jgi:hypothetical protein
MFKISVRIITHQPSKHNANYIPTSINNREGKVFFIFCVLLNLSIQKLIKRVSNFFEKAFNLLYICTINLKNIDPD